MSHPFDIAFREALAERCRSFPRIVHDDADLKRAAVAIVLAPADDGSGGGYPGGDSDRSRPDSAEWSPSGYSDQGYRSS